MLGMPRLASYQAARPAGSLARKKKPPMPVTRCIVAPYTLRAARKRRRALGVAYVLPMRPAEAVCGPRRNRQDWCRRPLDEGTADAATSGAAGGYAQGMLHDGERPRTPRLADPRAVLRRLAGLPRDLRRRVWHDLRRGRQRVARHRYLAQRRPGRELAALQRGPRLRRARPAEALEGVGPGGGARPRAGGRRGGGRVREPRRRRHLVAQEHARRP